MARLEKEEKVLDKIYYDVEEGFGSVRDLYEKARKVDVGITLDMVSTWMRAQPNKQTRNYKNYNSYTAPFPKYEFQIDLMDVTSLLRDVGSEIKSQLRYGLVCIDIFSTKCHIVPIENKDGDDVYKAVMECFKVLGQPLSIYSDDEGALNSKKRRISWKACGRWPKHCAGQPGMACWVLLGRAPPAIGWGRRIMDFFHIPSWTHPKNVG